MRKNVTIYDVAAHSGVSVASVSRVLAKAKYPVSEATRQKVLNSARELNYMVNDTGKMLKKQSTREIGVIVPNVSNPCYAALVEGMQAVAIRNDYHTLLYSSCRDSEIERSNIRMMMKKRVDGILLVSIGGKSDLLEQARLLGCRIITVEQVIDDQQLHVGYDYALAGALATRHLMEHGHRDIAFLGAQLDRPSRIQMLSGYRRALAEAGLAERAECVWLADVEAEQGTVFEIENGRAAARHMLGLKRRPTACVCLNDMIALGAMETFSNAGLRIPRDISIVGFDNVSYSGLSAPKLTTIDQHAARMGELAMQMMIERIVHPDIPQTSVEFAPELICRESVADAPCGDGRA